jgi:hypothetical protein
MKHAITALLSAASIGAFAWATPAAAQAIYGTPWPYGVESTYSGPYPTVPSHTGTPAYSYSVHNQGPYPGATGSCEVIAGNRVCNAAPAYGYGYGYGYGAYGPGPGGLVGAAVAAPVAAAGALAAAPFEAAGATAGALTGAPYAPGPYAPYAGPYAAAPVGAYPVAPVGPYPARRPMKGKSVVPTQTAYSLPPSEETAQPGVVGSCSVIAGNRVCTAAPAIP